MSTTYAAYSEGNDKIPDIGGRAMDFGETALQIEREEYKRKKDALDFQSDLVANNQDVFYASFENSGIKNLDIYNQKMAGLIKEKIEYANREFQNSDKSIEAQQRYQMQVAKLRGEVSQFKENVNGLISYGQKVTELGDQASAVMYDNVNRINNMMQDGVPSIDQDGNMQNVSIGVDEDGNRINESIKFSEMSNLTQTHQKQDMYGFATNAVKKFGKDSRFIDSEGKVVISTLLDRDGNLNESAKRIVTSDVGTGSDSDIIDVADQLDVGEPVRDEKGRLLNRKELVDAIAEKEVEYATQLVKEMTKTDDLLYAEYELEAKKQARLDRESHAKLNKGKGGPKSERSHYNSASAAAELNLGCATDVYTLTNAQKVDGVFGERGDDFFSDRELDDDMNQAIAGGLLVSPPTIVSYMTTADGRHFARTQYTYKERIPGTNSTAEKTTYGRAKLSREEANVMRIKAGLPQLSDIPDDPNMRKVEESASYQMAGNSKIYRDRETGKARDASTEFSRTTSTETKKVTKKKAY